MDPLRLAHLIAICLWGGLVLAEAVIELASRSDDEIRSAARLHYFTDLIIEIPLLVAIVTTGAVLTLRVWPPTPLHIIKIAAAFAAIAANAVCVLFVVKRHQAAQANDVARVRVLHRRVRWTGVGVPFALAAAAIGLARFSG
ncbi:MAG: hypothetical protein HYY84_08045 [Deltaproteobacteria bacterium]|nr:hypothetical protein [Deltaproteobacteria bacterium]